MHKILLLNLTLLFTSLTVSFPQDLKENEIKKQFDLAINLYNASSFYQANSIFNKIINDYDINSRTTASYFFSSKIYFEQ